MRIFGRALILGLLFTARADSAFETIRALSSPGAFDPIRPGLHYWHALPQRLVDAEPRLHLAGAQPYGIAALRTWAAELVLRPGPFGLGFSCTGLGRPDYYGELQISSAVAVGVRQWLALGLSAHYGRVFLGPRFGALQDLVAGCGLRLRAARKFSLDLSAGGLGTGTAGRRPLSTSGFRVGVTCDYSSGLSLRAGLGPEAGWTVGETIRLGPSLALAADLFTDPMRLQVGTLLGVGRFGFDFLYRDDPDLGGDLMVGILVRL